MKINFFKSVFGKRFGIADAILLLVLISYPIYIYFNATEGFILFNLGVDAILTEIGSSIWVGVFLAYILDVFLRRVKR